MIYYERRINGLDSNLTKIIPEEEIQKFDGREIDVSNLKNAVEELFGIEGIERVETDFSDISYNQDVIIDISYNPFLIGVQDIKQIELKLNI